MLLLHWNTNSFDKPSLTRVDFLHGLSLSSASISTSAATLSSKGRLKLMEHLIFEALKLPEPDNLEVSFDFYSFFPAGYGLKSLERYTQRYHGKVWLKFFRYSRKDKIQLKVPPFFWIMNPFFFNLSEKLPGKTAMTVLFNSITSVLSPKQIPLNDGSFLPALKSYEIIALSSSPEKLFAFYHEVYESFINHLSAFHVEFIEEIFSIYRLSILKKEGKISLKILDLIDKYYLQIIKVKKDIASSQYYFAWLYSQLIELISSKVTGSQSNGYSFQKDRYLNYEFERYLNSYQGTEHKIRFVNNVLSTGKNGGFA
ncbi:MAG: hypothetical protein LCH54_13780 [Bacteroidetes bacterium]|nr:hypothetical protein [Bacteroidota bacterium]